ncbi:MAG: hypothetical protein JO329_23465 [Planctomycetaceae bacterium]|nr:hypothetical protein [Planctomycetaceae bacterium]
MVIAPFSFDLSRCVVFDFEVYPNHWCCGFYTVTPAGEAWHRVVEDRLALEQMLERLARRNAILVGYNCGVYDESRRRYNRGAYDGPLAEAILAGLDPYEASRSLIEEKAPPGRVTLRGLPCDLIDVAERTRSHGRIAGLKRVVAYLGRPKLRELPFPPNRVLSEEEWDEVGRYNRVDLENTWAVLEHFTPELGALAALSQDRGLDLRSTPTSQVGETVFEAEYLRERGRRPLRPETPPEAVYRPVAGVRRPKTVPGGEWFDRVADVPLPLVRKGEKATILVPSATFTVDDVTLTVAGGGIHSDHKEGREEKKRPRRSRKHQVHYATGKYRLLDIDVASYYPTLMHTKGIWPASYGECGKPLYKEILERRLEVKRRAKTAADPAEAKRLALVATGLKLALNSTFGKTGEQNSSLYDPNAFLGVTLSGQLMLLDLVERLTAAGVRVLMVNTDGLMVKVRRSRDAGKRLARILRDWQRDTGMELEVEPLKRFVLLAANNYATLNAKGKIKRGGALLKGDFSPKLVPNALVIADAVAAALLLDVPPEATIAACTDLARFCRVTTSGSKTVLVEMVDDAGNVAPVPKVARWYKSRTSTWRIVHRQEGGNDTTPPQATEITLALDIVGGDLPDDLDVNWYIRQARAIIQATPGYPHLLPRLLGPAESLGRRVRKAGLFPIPKRGKSLPAGASPALPTYLWDWPQYPTAGTYTGPAVAILVIDVDDAVKFRMWVDRGDSPLLAPRWRDLDGALVVCRGDATADDVRAGLAPGKLCFRFEADAEHFLAKAAIDKWKEKYGFELFYGKGMPSVLGRHPDGSEYRLEGTLGGPPDWLIDGLRTPTRTSRKAPAGPSTNGHAPHVRHGHETAGPGRETAPLDGDGDATLAALRADLAEADPELGKPSVGWWMKDRGDDPQIAIGTCPYHSDGQDDLHAGYGDDGVPYVSCKHANCDKTRETCARLREIHHRRTGATLEPPPLEPTPLAEGMMADVVAGSIALHCAPTGSGKSHALDQAAVALARAGAPVVLVAPTIRTCGEHLGRLKTMAPDLVAGGAVAEVFGLRPAPVAGDDGDEGRGEDEAPPEGSYPVSKFTRIVVATHAQLGRRGFSRYLRGLWEKLGPDVDKTGAVHRPAFHLLVDEASEMIRSCRVHIPLEGRVFRRSLADGTGIKVLPKTECPKFNGSGRCDQCHQHDLAGEVVLNEPYQIRELRPVRITIEDSTDGKPCSRPHRPLMILEGTVAYEDLVRIGDTTFAGRVTHWRGTPVDEATRRTAAITIYRSSRAGAGGAVDHGIPDEPPLEVLDDWLRFAHRPVIVQDWPISAGGRAIAPEELCARIAVDKKAWADGVLFPYATCAVRRLLFTDLAPLEQVRRFAARHGRGVVFAGATVGEDDRAILREVWPDLAVRAHPYPPRRIRQAAVLLPSGKYGHGSLCDRHAGRLITAPLEPAGLGLIFNARKSQAEALFTLVRDAHPTARLVVGNDEVSLAHKDVHTEGRPGVYVTYARGVLGLGANVAGVRWLVINCNAFRAINSFNPGAITPEEFEKMRAAERTSLIFQNLGRAIRGEAGKTVVLILLNADAHLFEALRTAEALRDGSELPPVFATGDDLVRLIDQSRRWLDAGGGAWPDADLTKAAPKKGRRQTRTRETVLEAAEVAIRDGTKWREFARREHVSRHLTPGEQAALKDRFDAPPSAPGCDRAPRR